MHFDKQLYVKGVGMIRAEIGLKNIISIYRVSEIGPKSTLIIPTPLE